MTPCVNRGPERMGIRVIVVILWLRSVSPSLVQILIEGRPAFNDLSAPPATSSILSAGLTAALFPVAGWLVISGIRRREAVNIGWLAAFMLPWATLWLADAIAGYRLDTAMALYPLIGIACWLNRPSINTVRIFGYLTASTAIGALVLGVAAPDVGLFMEVGSKTFYLDGLLAGPFLHSNVLGIALALGIPFVLTIRGPRTRTFSMVCCLAALAWSGSRSAAVSVAAACSVLAGTRLSKASLNMLVVPALLLGGLLVVAVPIQTSDPDAFTQRGQIWLTAVDAWKAAPYLGNGPRWFVEQTQIRNDLGGMFSHGHNFLIQVLVTGGILTMLAYLIQMTAAWRRTSRYSPPSRLPLFLFLVSATWIGVLEASFVNVTASGFLLWLPLAIISFGTEPPETDVPEKPEEAKHPTIPQKSIKGKFRLAFMRQNTLQAHRNPPNKGVLR